MVEGRGENSESESFNSFSGFYSGSVQRGALRVALRQNQKDFESLYAELGEARTVDGSSR
jgi:hypothetical protein